MSEINDVNTEEKPSKLNSRKFIVWLVWLVLTLIYSAIFAVYLIITKTAPDNLIDFAKLVLHYFFVISCLYLGVNIVGKGIGAVKDIFIPGDKDEER